jgi:predicted amidohydrolase YtcJ
VDLVLLDANVITMDAATPRAEALAVSGGRIVAVGATAAIERLAGPETRVVRLPGRTIIPGFVEPHAHLSLAVLEPLAVDCGSPPHGSVQEVLAAIQATAAHTVPGRWIRGWGLRPRVLAEGRAPTRRELDDVAPTNPVCILDGSVHGVYANSAALAAAGIGRETRDPAYGHIARDGAGEPDGALWETAADLVSTPSMRAQLQELGERVVDLVDEAGRRCLALGITAVSDALVVPETGAMYRRADAAGRLPLGLHQMLGGDAFFARPFDVARGNAPGGQRADDDAHISDRLRGGTLKLFMDPVFPGPARIRFRPDGTAERFGARYYTQDEANEIVLAAHRRGMQVAIHCMGTWSIDQALDAIEHALRAAPAEDPRFRIEHFTTPIGPQIRRARSLGVVPVVQPAYILAPRPAGAGNLLADLGGDVRLHPYRTMLDEGVVVAGSSDYPCAPLQPLVSVGVLVTRRGPAGVEVGPDEAVTPMDALRMYTLNGALAMRREHEIGSIEPGKRADLVVLSDDPTSSDPSAIPSIDVLQTWLAGTLAYEVGAA